MKEVNKQQQIFLSEYCPKKSTPGKFTYINLTFSSKMNKCTKVEKNANSFLGFVQGLEFLKKSWNLPSSFPALEKSGKWR